MLEQKKLGVIGFGKMGRAIVSGMFKKNSISASQVIGCDLSPKIRTSINQELGVEMLSDPKEIATRCDIILLSVKPFHIASVCEEISHLINPNHLLISVAAGISTAFMEKRLPKNSAVIRVMPNTPALINEGMSVLSKGQFVSEEQLELATKMFNAVGDVATVEEPLMDAVTAISGSGPAYMFLMLEAMADAGLKMGLKKDVATKLATQTMLGAAKLVKETGEMPAKLKDDVTTPAGTTIEGLVELEHGNFRSTVINAILKAKERSTQLVSND